MSNRVAEVDVLLANIRDYDCEAMAGLLAPDDQIRLAQIGHVQRRAQFILGRLLLRLGLYRRYGNLATAWRLDSRIGRPQLVGVDAPEISISHASEVVVCAISEETVGIDVECCRKRDFLMLIEYLGGVEGRRSFFSLDEEAKNMAFYRMWTLGEALFKLSREGGCESSWWGGGLDGGDGIRHAFFHPKPGYLAAVAVLTTGSIRLIRHSPRRIDFEISS